MRAVRDGDGRYQLEAGRVSNDSLDMNLDVHGSNRPADKKKKKGDFSTGGNEVRRRNLFVPVKRGDSGDHA